MTVLREEVQKRVSLVRVLSFMHGVYEMLQGMENGSPGLVKFKLSDCIWHAKLRGRMAGKPVWHLLGVLGYSWTSVMAGAWKVARALGNRSL